MKKLIIASLVLVAAAATSVLYVWTETQDSGVAAERGVVPPAQAEVEGAAAPAPPTSTDVAANAQATGGEAASEEPTERREIDLETAKWREGWVRLPAGTPADERVEIALIGAGGSREATLRDENDERFWADKRVLYRAEVAADGRFRVPLPEGDDELRLVLRARYGYLDGPHNLDRSNETPVELKPRLGAWVTGRVVLPEGANASEFDVEAARLELGFNALAFAGGGGVAPPVGLRNHETHANSDLSFEFRGVVASVERDVRVRPAKLAAKKSQLFKVGPGEHATMDVQLSRGATLLGRVVDEKGAPVAGAKLTVIVDPVAFGQGGYEVREGESDATGAFALAAVTPGKVELIVTKKGTLDRKLPFELTEGVAKDAGDVVLSSGEVVAGHVRWSDGRPCTGAKVEVNFDPAALGGMSGLNALQGANGEGVVDADGAFEVSGLGKGPFVVTVAARPEGAERDHRARVAGVKPGTRDLELVLAAPLELSGRVLDTLGAPVVGATVRAIEDSGGMMRSIGGRRVNSKPTGDDGSFVVSDLSPGTWSLDARAEGFTRCAPVDVTLARDEVHEPLELKLERGGAILGRVLRPDGTPAAGASVRQRITMESLRSIGAEENGVPRSATAGEDGNFRFGELGAGLVQLVASLDGFATSTIVEAQVKPGEETRDVVLTLRIGGRITGEVYAKDGTPAAGAQVIAQLTADPLSQRFATSDREGLFAFEHMAPGAYQVLHIPGMGGGSSNPEDATAMFGDMKMASATVEDGAEVHVVLGAPPKDPVEISGRVLAGEEGVPSVVLSFFPDAIDSISGLKLATTDSAGRFSLRLDGPGRYTVSIQKPGASGQQQSITQSLDVPSGASFGHDFHLPLGSIAGRVTDGDGRPVAHVRVSLFESGPVRNGTLMGEHYSEIETGEDGRYELVWLKPREYAVAVGGAALGGLLGGSSSSGRQVREGVAVQAERRTDGIDFQLHKPGRITGVVRQADGTPAGEAAIFARDAQGRPLERLSMIATDSSGRFSYEGLEPGDYTVLARKDTLTTGESSRLRVEEGRTTEVELALHGGTILLVSLSGDDGEPLDCTVSVLDEAGRQVNGTMALTEVMAAFSNGTLNSKEQRVGPLTPGKYRVTVVADDGRKTTKPVTLTGQAERKLNIRL
ncbi:MAG: carboxypeptidase-like regulatory domain-containing protein [Planctomycetota bacterium]|nr:carboxypeptidase-like regulatory domain-containing protein [Planctomycetota bacterium]